MTEQLPSDLPAVSEPMLNTREDPYKPFDENLSCIGYMDALLKTPNRLQCDIQMRKALPAFRGLSAVAFFGFLLYGLVMGMFSGGVQIYAAPLKILACVTAASILCLPSLYIFTSLGGLDLRPMQLLAQGMSGLALTAMLLLGLTPVLFLFSVSTESLVFMGMLHGIMWIVAGGTGGKRFLKCLSQLGNGKSYYPLLWIWIFSLVLMQLSTTLRPVLGSSETLLASEKQFFLFHWLDVLSGAE